MKEVNKTESEKKKTITGKSAQLSILVFESGKGKVQARSKNNESASEVY
jgi:hypothetical protein